MASNYEYVTSTGTVVPDTSTIQDEVVTDYVEVWEVSEEAARDTSTSEGREVEYITNIRKSTAINNAKFSNQINPNLAEDGYFDAIYALFGGERDGAERSSSDCTLNGVAGTVVPAGSFARNSSTQSLWYSASEAVLDSNGEATVTFFSDETGAIAAGVGEIDQIVTAITGWETITNPATATEGSDQQSLPNAKLERSQKLATNSSSRIGSVISNVLALEGVIGVQGRENRSSSSQTIDGITIPAKSTWLCVDGGSIDSIVEQYVTRSYGTDFYGDANTVTGSYTDPISTQEYSVDFDRPTEVPIKIEVTASLVSSTDLITQIKDAVLLWASGGIDGYTGAMLGNDISPFEISAALNQYFGASSIYISKVRVTTVADDTYGFDVIDVNLWEKATVESSNIEVISL